MEVFFDKTVGLYPVALVADEPAHAPASKAGTNGSGSRSST
jgi:hypothetical protein